MSKTENKITVVGSGYVGMSIGVLLGANVSNDVTILDIDENKVDSINNKISPILDEDIDNYIQNNKSVIHATTEKHSAYKNTDYVIICVPTNYSEKLNTLDTSIVDEVVAESIKNTQDSLIVIKSTIPIGHTQKLKKIHRTERIIFSPEFLREGFALHDNLYPSRIVVGGKCQRSIDFANLLTCSTKNNDYEIIYTDSKEAECIKLFSNTYLAMRIAFFNELDSFSLTYNLDSKSIINGVSLDKRIGQFYNNPSFGYGGYCLPKDTKGLSKSFNELLHPLIKSIDVSNENRKSFISKKIKTIAGNKTIGFYKLGMKQNSDNFRSSSIIDILNSLSFNNEIFIYEPSIGNKKYKKFKVINDLDLFIKSSDLIVCNRMSDSLERVREKCFTRDVFGIN